MKLPQDIGLFGPWVSSQSPVTQTPLHKAQLAQLYIAALTPRLASILSNQVLSSLPSFGSLILPAIVLAAVPVSQLLQVYLSLDHSRTFSGRKIYRANRQPLVL